MKYNIWIATYKNLPEGEEFETINPETKEIEYRFDYSYSQDFEVEKIERTERIPKSWEIIFKAVKQVQKEKGGMEKQLQRKFYNIRIRTEEKMTNEGLEWKVRDWLRDEGHKEILIEVSKVRKKVKVRKCGKCGGRLKSIKHEKYQNALQCKKCKEIYVSLSIDFSKFSPKVIEGLKKAKKAGEKLPFDLDLEEETE